MQYSLLQQSFDQQFDRSQQINETLVAQAGSRALNPDRSLLEVAFTLQDGTPASVRASLPPTFPQDPPSLSATPALQHPWINPDGKLEPPSLASWGRGGARLAAVVQQVVAELAAKARASPSAHTTYAVPATPNPISPTLPDLPRSFPLLDSLSNEQLLEALTQPSKFEELERRVAAELHLEQPVEAAWQQARELAEGNIARGDEMADCANQIAIIQSSEYQPAETAFRDLHARQKAVLDKLAPRVLLERLAASAKEAEAASDALVAGVSGGHMSVEAWAEQYMRARTAYHMRDLKHHAAQQSIPQT
ncbi:VPS37 [Auxenochlorella protothecoides x Auxenochlorella symbiontica]|uniref:VPS37 C-terminal domain-containing protein n=1 Tax=Auxenochlorella protothecoides TaxID=3075 RepID=A0A1D1ZSN4_AUXPR